VFGNYPWQYEFGPPPRWRAFAVPTLVVGAVTLFWLLQHGALLSGLTQWYLTPDGDTTLELPDDLVLAWLPSSYLWNPDPAADGIMLALPDKGDPSRQAWSLERWGPPWTNGKRERIPAEWRAIMPPNWQDQTAICWHFGLNSPVTRDGSLLATVEYGGKGPSATRVLVLPGGQEIGRVPTIPAGINGKCIAWHPIDNVLVIGGYGTLTLAAGPHWETRTLATAARDFREWEARVQTGDEECGYSPNENVSQLAFSDDGKLLLAAMDRGVRVYDWPEVQKADGELPAPRAAVDGVLVPQPLGSFKMTFSVAYDVRRRLVLWSENDGKLKYLNLSTCEHDTLLTLTNRYCCSRIHLCSSGDAVVCEIVRLGKSGNGPFMLAVLDYPRLLQRGGVEPAVPDAQDKHQ
jgi:hypothetical protein